MNEVKISIVVRPAGRPVERSTVKAPPGGGKNGIFKEMHNWCQNNSLLLSYVCPDQTWRLPPCRPHLQKSFSVFQEH